MGTFPINLELAGRRVLVVGAGPVGRRRAAAVARTGARVRWVSPDIERAPEIEGDVDRVAARFEVAHLDGVELVLACAPAEINSAVIGSARMRGVWVGRADTPSDGDFTIPARIERGRLRLTLGTGGFAPAAVPTLRAALEAWLPDAWVAFVEYVGQARGDLAGELEGRDRIARLRQIASPAALEAIVRGEWPPAH